MGDVCHGWWGLLMGVCVWGGGGEVGLHFGSSLSSL